MFQSPSSIALSIGGLQVHWYGILISVGILLAFFYAVLELKRRKLPTDPVFDIGFWTVLFGVIGSRLYYVFFLEWGFYKDHLIDIFAVWKGGLAIHGALLGGFLASFVYAKLKKISWLTYADIAAPGIILAQAVGRWGNFFNNEAFGAPTDLPWKLFIPEAFRPFGFEDAQFFHPAFLYEFLWNLMGFAILHFLMRKIYKNDTAKKPGLIFFSYLIFYSIGRFLIESIRLDSSYIGSFKVAQVASVGLVVGGVIGVIKLKTQSSNFKTAT